MRTHLTSIDGLKRHAARSASVILAASALWACGSTSGNNASSSGGASQGSGAGGGQMTSGSSAGGDGGAPGDAGSPDAPAVDACSAPAIRVVPVKTTAELTAAIAGAMPGDRIELADGTYAGDLVAMTPGTADHPIAVCGSHKAVIEGKSADSGYGFHLQASYWILSGFSVTTCQKGVVLDGVSHAVVSGLEVSNIGDEGIHLRAFSSDNIVEGCFVHDTGTSKPGFGEGIYIGSANSNWGTYSGGKPDTSDHNQILDNHIGPNVAAECIDIKEGTTGGLIRGNTFDGHGMSGQNYADSWIDVKGNGYTLEDNHGDTAILDGFQTHVAVDGWGQDNTFTGNVMTNLPGYGINVDKDSMGTVVSCTNTVDAKAMGLSNIACK